MPAQTSLHVARVETAMVVQWRVNAPDGRFMYLRNADGGWFVVTFEGQVTGPFKNRFNCKVAAEQMLGG